MRKLTYWVANCLDDDSAYSIRHRTRKAVQAQLSAMDTESRLAFGKPRKVTVEYQDAFDLLDHALGEGGISEGQNSEEGYIHVEDGEWSVRRRA